MRRVARAVLAIAVVAGSPRPFTVLPGAAPAGDTIYWLRNPKTGSSAVRAATRTAAFCRRAASTDGVDVERA